ncbi:MAG: GNAT family N-acetyltransferase [Lachnospiraceae bacterium]|nr:GNAT family N-acetyltransferase [Lachnospiraceae bacterium]
MKIVCFTAEDKKAHYEELLRMTAASDREFVPPLSERKSTIQKDLSGGHETGSVLPYFREMMDQEIIAAVEDGAVQAFLSYRKDHEDEEIGRDIWPNLYLSTMISRPEARGKGIGGKIFRVLLEEIYPDRPAFTRTWSTNAVQLHVFQKLGFREIRRVKDGRGPGIDTIYFVRDSFRAF